MLTDTITTTKKALPETTAMNDEPTNPQPHTTDSSLPETLATLAEYWSKLTDIEKYQAGVVAENVVQRERRLHEQVATRAEVSEARQLIKALLERTDNLTPQAHELSAARRGLSFAVEIASRDPWERGTLTAKQVRAMFEDAMRDAREAMAEGETTELHPADVHLDQAPVHWLKGKYEGLYGFTVLEEGGDRLTNYAIVLGRASDGSPAAYLVQMTDADLKDESE